MNKSPLTLAACALVALGGASLTAVEIVQATGDGATDEHVVRAPVHTVVVDAEDGDVLLERAPAGAVRVRVHRNHLINTPETSEEVAGGVLELRTRCPIGFVACRSDYRIGVPPGVTVRIDKASGRVDARGVGGGVTEVREDAAPLQLRTS